MKRQGLLLLLLFMSLIFCIVITRNEINRHNDYSRKTEQALNNISRQLGVKNDWESVRFEIYCNILGDNVTLDEIKKDLTGVTSFEIGRDDEKYLHYTIYFTDPYAQIDDVGLTFNDQQLLIEKFLRVGLGGSDIAPINCNQ